MAATVVGIYIAETRKTSLRSQAEAALEAGKGIVGDRYYLRAGSFSEQLKSSADWEVTLIECEEIERFNETEKATLSPGEFRRNIVTSGIRLNDLVGQRFAVGESMLEGIRLCEPCAHLAKLTVPGIVKGMAHRAGLRARVVTGAVVRPGDSVKAI